MYAAAVHANPPPSRPLVRWSLSTRIFLAFALVVACTGAASVYAVAAVSALRHELGLLRRQALPLQDELQQSADGLRGFDEALQRAAPEDLDWVVRLLPNARPYQRIDRILARLWRYAGLAQPAGLARLVWRDTPALQAVEAELAPIRHSAASRQRMVADAQLLACASDLGSAADDAAAFDVLAASLQRAIADKRLGDAARLVVELRRMIRQVHGAFAKAKAGLDRTLALRAEQAQRAESNLVAVVTATALVSFFVSMAMLLASLVALRPLAALTAVVRQFAAGDRAARARVAGAQEIALLADEWNRMAEALDRREAQLLAQREDLARAERLTALGHMAARMAHEVRNPLSSIGLNAEMLGEELGRPGELDRAEASELVAAIGAEVERLRELTAGYLVRARPAACRQWVDLGALVRELLDFLKPELQQRNISVVFDPPAAAAVPADPAALRQVLWNLLRNAWEAMSQGGSVWIEVTVRADGADQVPWARIAVEDSGPGVPAELDEQIFQPFFSNKARGTGIGLAVVREIARDHKGTARLLPGMHGSGARFEVALPVQQPPELGEERSGPPAR
ncbi:MAG: hypothetical protein FJ100_10850 [Deltaproteobacteria bacterium]|nr:hypothetical protein [Deltaproteobacteria bacterium]